MTNLHRWYFAAGLTLCLPTACASDDGADSGAADGSDGADDTDGGDDDGDDGDGGDDGADDGGDDAADDSGDEGPGDPPPMDDDGGDEGPSEPPPANAPNLPPVTGNCPDFMQTVDTNTYPITLTFNPDGVGERQVRMWAREPMATQDGPVIFYWHGTGSDPNEAIWGIGESNIDAFANQGGIVIAPFNDPATGTFPWWLTTTNNEDDILLMDEVIACAQQEVGIDSRRIHSMGFSAGGMMSTQLSWRRAVYLASVVSYSGGYFGGVPPADTDPDNLFSAMIIHGGTSDTYGSTGFVNSSEYFAELLQGAGRFAVLCDHGNGHTVPSGNDQIGAMLQFLEDHPWGTSPSPYTNGLPGSWPNGYCSIP